MLKAVSDLQENQKDWHHSQSSGPMTGSPHQNLRGFRASVNPRFQGAIPDFMDNNINKF